MAFLPGNNNSRHTVPQSLLKRLVQAVRQRRVLFAEALFSRFEINGDNGAPAGTASQEIEKRRHPRIGLTNTSVNVTDGCMCATAYLANISPSGLCLCNLPEQLYRSASHLTIFSSDNPGLPVLQIQPRWEQTGWNGKTIGAAVVNAPRTWRLFFLRTASQLEA